MKTKHQFTVSGMSCQGCANTIERVVSKLPGVEACAVSFATQSMTVQSATARPEAIIQAVADLGYQAAASTEKKT